MHKTKFEDIVRQWNIFEMKHTYIHTKRLKKIKRALMTYGISSTSKLYVQFKSKKERSGETNFFLNYGLKFFKLKNKSINLKNYEVPWTQPELVHTRKSIFSHIIIILLKMKNR